MKVLIVSTYDANGGAARAAYRLLEALTKAGIECRMSVMVQSVDSSLVIRRNSLRLRLIKYLIGPNFVKRLERLQKSQNLNTRSISLIGSGLVSSINASDADVVNLHWIHAEMLSVGDILKIRKPVVWTLHDMWAFCGSEHYDTDEHDARWRVGYTRSSRNPMDSGPDLDRWVWRRKANLWKKVFHLVTPSRWLADCCRESALLKDWPVEVIPNPLDLDVFRPWPKAVAREAFKLPTDKKLILFGAHGLDRSGRKGVDLLYGAMRILKGNGMDVHGVLFGQPAPENPPDVGMPLHWVGRLHDDISLALLYSAADVMVVSSRLDNLPQTGTEAQSCGCPVVAFQVGGLSDIVEHQSTGYLARPFDVDDLAHGIEWVLEDRDRYNELCTAAREKSLMKWKTDRIVTFYKRTFQRAIDLKAKQNI